MLVETKIEKNQKSSKSCERVYILASNDKFVPHFSMLTCFFFKDIYRRT